MESTPQFEEAVERFRAFIRGFGWPESIIWRCTNDVLLFPGPRKIVRARSEVTADAWARRFYDEGTRAGGGISLYAACVVNGRTCSTIFWTSDQRTAQLMMMPVSGLKLSCSMHRFDAKSLGAIRWWLAKQVLDEYHAELKK